MDGLWYQIGISPAGALGVVLATILLYLAFSLVVRFSWRYFGASHSSFELALVTVLGAVVGRSMLGNAPTLFGGAIALATLFTLEGGIGLVRRSSRYSDLGHIHGVIVMAGGDIDLPELRRLGITERDFWTSLRRHGIHNVNEVGAVVVEHDGTLSILRAGTPVNRAIMVGVRGAADLPDDFYSD
ncbi:MAG: DUF421 domain-containing protein [Actinomycetota bacterium]